MNAPATPAWDAQIDARLTALLYRNAGLGQAINVIVSGLVAALGYVSRPGAVILAWWGLSATLSLYRLQMSRRFLRGEPGADEVARRRRHFFWTTVLSAVLWLIGAAAVMWHNADPYRLLVALALAGMVAGAVPVLGAVKPVFRVYAVTMLGGAALLVLVDASTPVHYVFGLCTIVMLGAVLRSANFLHDTLVEALRLDLDKGRMLASLEEARAGAEAANLAKTQFLATMSHELRTPLTGMLGMAELLTEGAVSEDERKEYALIILNSGKTLLALLNDILDLSKVEAGKMEIALSDFFPAQLLDEVGALFNEAARRKGLALDVVWHCAPGAHYVSDPFRVRQILTNLIGNAVKFTERGAIRIEGRELSRAGVVCDLEFAVTDTGVGIAPDKLPLLFQPFSQVDNSHARKSSGTGLGLSIVRRLAQLMDGDAGASSEPGQGSRFWVRLRATRMN